MAKKTGWNPVDNNNFPQDELAVQVTYLGYYDGKPYCDEFAYRLKGNWYWKSDDELVGVPITAWRYNCKPYSGLKKSPLQEGDRVSVSGDAAELWLQDYNVRVSTQATVIDTPSPRDKKVLVSLDEIDGHQNVWCMIRKSKVTKL